MPTEMKNFIKHTGYSWPDTFHLLSIPITFPSANNVWPAHFICFSYLCRISKMKLPFQLQTEPAAMNDSLKRPIDVHTFSKCDRFCFRCVKLNHSDCFFSRLLLRSRFYCCCSAILSIKLNWTGSRFEWVLTHPINNADIMFVILFIIFAVRWKIEREKWGKK